MPTEAPPVEVQATSSQPQSAGMSRFFADVTKAANTPEPAPEMQPSSNPSEKPADAAPKTEVKPEVKPADKAPEKPAEKPGDKKPVTPPKPPEHKEAPPELRKRVDELSKSEKQLKIELETLRGEREELSKKRTWTDDDQKRFDEAQKEASELRRQIAETAYEKSDEFKKQYVEPYKNRLQNAINTTVRYFPVVNQEDGTQRAATEADFWKVAGSPISDRAAMATQLFGHNAANIIADIRRLEELKESADQAISAHNQGLEEREKQTREQWQTKQKQYQHFRELSRKQLEEDENLKKFFGEPADDPELSEAWKAGNDFVERIAGEAEKMTIEEMAAAQEVVRARAAWFTRGHLENKRLKTKLAEVEAELAKFRDSDPGAEKEKGKVPQPQTDDLSGGIQKLAARFDSINS